MHLEDPETVTGTVASRVSDSINTERFNSFLRELCRERGIALVDDGIVAVDADDGFEVSDAVKREEDEYYAGVTDDIEDFYTTRELYKAVLGM